MKHFFTFALLTLSVAAQADPQTVRFYGYAYDLDSGRYLYTEVHRDEIDQGHWLSGHIGYFDADDKPLGEKTLSFASDPYIPVYKMAQPGVGYSEGITRIAKDGIDMFKQSREKGLKNATISRYQPMTADSGFHCFLYDRMQDLLSGTELKFRFAAAGQLDSFSFRAHKVGDTEFEGKPAVQLKVEPDSLLRYMVSPLLLTYDPQTRRLLEYRGVSNVINPATGKAYNARIAFFSKPPDDAPKNLPPLD
ncbi:MAG: hypothetical protein P4L83_20555 [Nevskia sp.]|nr:hypothetical protein [Nevskia sp.]